ncbi:hypothetical protein TSOC_013072 [Tetrabaena socialis]|uniref:Uncharacterized protein n=1 Tax=Tetrabaena socialis TaxID=47790 RepID=A0A2J7ZLB2_9CHLO|nr:hypothetical protein TSOC_013072 [Tetrabaena socialis]|eukprot:PNH01059.1 hypothetical protein TSOC_013072 [Tetrabaena socialis]
MACLSRTGEEWAPEDVDAVALVSQYGRPYSAVLRHAQVRLQLRRDWAPKACAAVARMAAGAARGCAGCTWYRHEPAPEGWGVGGFFGPPYGLLQGGLPGLGAAVESENAALRPVTVGVAAFIAGSTDFFIGTVDHSEWGGSFTAFAQVPAEDMEAVAAVPMVPYRNSTDSYNFTTRWLLERAPFKLQPLRRAELSSEMEAGLR